MTQLTIRPFTAGDAAEFHRAATESFADLQAWMPWVHPAYSLEEAAVWTKLKAQTFANRSEFEFLVVDDDDAIIGACGLNQIDTNNRRANIGYWIRSSQTRKNFATDAVKLVVQWAAANTDVQRIEVVVATDNIASLRVAEKARAIREGVLGSRLLLRGSFHDAVMCAFIRDVNMRA